MRLSAVAGCCFCVLALFILQTVKLVYGSVIRERLVFGTGSEQGEASCCWLLSDGAFQVEPRVGASQTKAELRLYGRLSRSDGEASGEQRPAQVEFVFYPGTKRQYIGYREPQKVALVQYCCPRDVADNPEVVFIPGCTAKNAGEVLVTTTAVMLPTSQRRAINRSGDNIPGDRLAKDPRRVQSRCSPAYQLSLHERGDAYFRCLQSSADGETATRGHGECSRNESSPRVLSRSLFIKPQAEREVVQNLPHPILRSVVQKMQMRPVALDRQAGEPASQSLDLRTLSTQEYRTAPELLRQVASKLVSALQRVSRVSSTTPNRVRYQQLVTKHENQGTPAACNRVSSRNVTSPAAALHQRGTLKISRTDEKYLQRANACRSVSTEASTADVYRYKVLLPAFMSRIDFGTITFPVHQSGIHELLVASCTGANLTMRLVTEWQHPHGYLAAQLYPLLPFYGWMTLLYLAAAAIWVFVCYSRTGIVHIGHHATTFLLMLGLFESFLHYQVYHWANLSGARVCCPPSGMAIVGDLLATFRHTLTKVLLLAAGMGLQLVSPKLPAHKLLQLKWFAVLYTLGAGTLEILETFAHVERARLLLLLPVTLAVACLETLFYFWIVAELRQTWMVLRSRDQPEKRRNFRLFMVLLATFAGLGIVYTVFVIVFSWRASESVTGLTDENWRFFWLIGPYPGLGTGAFGDAAFFLVLASIAWVWFPAHSQNAYLPMTSSVPAEHESRPTRPAKSPKQRTNQSERVQARFELDDDTNAPSELLRGPN